MTMTDERVDFYTEAEARKRIERDGTADKAFATTQAERNQYPYRSRSRAALRLDGIIAVLRTLAKADRDAKTAERQKLLDVAGRQTAAICTLLGKLAENPTTAKPLAAVCRALAPVFDDGGIEWGELLLAASEYAAGGTPAELLRLAQRVAEGEASDAAEKWEWERMNRKAADVALLAATIEELEYGI